MKLNSFVARIAAVILWGLSGLGVAGIIFLIPILSSELSQQYVEYRGDFVALVVVLSFLAGCIVSVLVVVSLLLTKVAQGNLIRESSRAQVSALSISFVVLASSIIILFVWLSSQNTMPPGLVLILFGGVALSIAAALVTRSLSSVLVEAISNSEELEGVI
jgi:uncharacterized membrane protein